MDGSKLKRWAIKVLRVLGVFALACMLMYTRTVLWLAGWGHHDLVLSTAWVVLACMLWARYRTRFVPFWCAVFLALYLYPIVPGFIGIDGEQGALFTAFEEGRLLSLLIPRPLGFLKGLTGIIGIVLLIPPHKRRDAAVL